MGSESTSRLPLDDEIRRVSDFADITDRKKRREKSLTVRLKKHSGRNFRERSSRVTAGLVIRSSTESSTSSGRRMGSLVKWPSSSMIPTVPVVLH